MFCCTSTSPTLPCSTPHSYFLSLSINTSSLQTNDTQYVFGWWTRCHLFHRVSCCDWLYKWLTACLLFSLDCQLVSNSLDCVFTPKKEERNSSSLIQIRPCWFPSACDTRLILCQKSEAYLCSVSSKFSLSGGRWPQSTSAGVCFGELRLLSRSFKVYCVFHSRIRTSCDWR